MKTDELMKGNIIRLTLNSHSEIIKVYGVVGDNVYFGDKDFLPLNSYHFSPVEITETSLLELGFKKIKHPPKICVISEVKNFYYFKKGYVVFDFNRCHNVIIDNYSLGLNIKYVHKLQNILNIFL